MSSITVAANVFQEPNTLPGFFECYSRWADDILIMSCPPSGAPPDEETIEIVKKWGATLIHAHIDWGFGAARTNLIHSATTEWVLISDADERVFPQLPVYDLHGEGKYPEDANPGLSVGIAEPCFSQIDLLRGMVNNAGKDVEAIRFCRRHWFNWAMTKPCQRWDQHPDWQLRFMRNREHIGYDMHIRMHEKARNFNTGQDPHFISSDTRHGPFYDHFHLPAKAMEPDQRARDVEIYNALSVDGHIEKLAELYADPQRV